MKLEDALKIAKNTTKRIKLYQKDVWLHPNVVLFTAKEVLSTNWEVEDDKVEVSRRNAAKLYRDTIQNISYDEFMYRLGFDMCEKTTKK